MWLSRLTNKSLKYARKNIEYLVLFVFLVFIIGSTLYLFIYKGIAKNEKEQLTYIISILGLTFALFQFLFNHIATKKRKIFDLRYGAYKEVIVLIDSFAEYLHGEIYGRKISNSSDLVLKLSKLTNKIASTLNEYNYYLFPKVKDSPESVDLETIILKIKFIGYKYDSEVINNSMKSNASEYDEANAYSNWFNEVRDSFDEFEVKKSKFYEKLREYLNY